jgi:glycosyltransferase involved in cell wall biosynthesis
MLLALCTYDTPENNRAWMTQKTVESLVGTVDFNRHRLFISDNGSTDPATIALLQGLDGKVVGRSPVTVIWNEKNRGTAVAINKAWEHRKLGEHALKMDNDVVIHHPGWLKCSAAPPSLVL